MAFRHSPSHCKEQPRSYRELADSVNNSNFLLRAYPTMKKNNPSTPIMMREAAGTVPKVFARYGKILAFMSTAS